MAADLLPRSTFRVSDGTQTSNLATVSVAIDAVNDAPVASAGTLAVAEDRAEHGMLIGSDVDGDTLAFELVDAPAMGTVTITNPATGRYRFTPDPNAQGSDTFTFRVLDALGASNPATVAVVITGINDAPSAQDAGFSTAVGTPLSITLPASDPDGDPLVFQLTSTPRHGAITAFDAATGAMTYVPDPGFSGQDTFRFRVSDGARTSQPATVTITVVP